MSRNMQLVLSKLVEGVPLQPPELQDTFRSIMRGEIPESLVAALLVKFPAHGVSSAELTAAARVVREFIIPVAPKDELPLIDLCGTGGSSTHIFNVSTTASFVAAAAGCYVAKHGNRSISSCCGSADVLEAVGLNLKLNSAELALCLEEIGIAFMFTPMHRPALPTLNKIRKELAVRTVFNVLGPLTNPAGAKTQLVGVFDRSLTAVTAESLKALGSHRAFVVHGEEGLDEISISGRTFIAELRAGTITEFILHPHDLDIEVASLSAIQVNSVEQAKDVFMGVLHNELGPAKDIVLINAAAALYLSGKTESLIDGVRLAAQTLESGSALRKYESLVAYTQRYTR